MGKDSREIEVFKKEYSTLFSRWQKENKDLMKCIDDVTQELDSMKEPLDDDQKKQQRDLIAKRKKAQDAADNAASELHIELMALDPPTNVSKDEMNDLLKWMKKTFEAIKKGLPATKTFTIQPDLDVDLPKGKIKSLGVNLIWNF